MGRENSLRQKERRVCKVDQEPVDKAESDNDDSDLLISCFGIEKFLFYRGQGTFALPLAVLNLEKWLESNNDREPPSGSGAQ